MARQPKLINPLDEPFDSLLEYEPEDIDNLVDTYNRTELEGVEIYE